MFDFESTFSSILQQFGLSGDNWQARPWKGDGYSGSQIWQITRDISSPSDLKDATANLLAFHPRGLDLSDPNSSDSQLSSPEFRASEFGPLTFGAQDFCLKAHPQANVHLPRINWQARMIHSGSELPFLLPPCPTLENDFAWVHAGLVWQMEPWATGANDFHQKPNFHRVVSVMRALAELHHLWFQQDRLERGGNLILQSTSDESVSHDPSPLGPSPGLATRLSMLEQWTPSLNNLWEAVARGTNNAPVKDTWSPAVNEIRQRTELHWNRVRESLLASQELPLPMGAVLGDPWSDHLFFEGDELSSIIDYGTLRIDSVAADLSRVLCSLVGDNAGLTHLALQEYQIKRNLSEPEAQAIEVYSWSSRILGPLLWLRWIFLEHRFQPTATLLDRVLKISRGQPF